MKVPFRKDTAAALAEAEKALVTCEAAIATARQQRLDLLLDGEPAEIAALDVKIIEQHRVAAVHRERLNGLQIRLDQEQAAEREKRRQQAIKTVEAMLPDREKVVGEIEGAIKSLPRLFERLFEWKAKFIERYPSADVEYPFAHFIDSDRVLRIVVEALRNIRAEDFYERIDGLAASEAEQHAALVADLKSNPSADNSAPANSEAA